MALPNKINEPIMTDNVTRMKTSDTVSRVAILEHQMNVLGTDIKQLETKVEQQYSALHSRISDMRDDMHAEINDKHDRLIAKLDEQSKEHNEQHKEINERVGNFDKWRWMIMGGAIVVGYVLAHLKIENLF
jgi:DNA anti-recombination protein RmuC